MRVNLIQQDWNDRKTAYLSTADLKGAVIVDILKKPYGKFAAGDAYIYSLQVDQDARREGYGNLLIEKAEEWARMNGATKAWLKWDNTDSQKWVEEWYVRRGYEERCFGEDTCLMVKDISI